DWWTQSARGLAPRPLDDGEKAAFDRVNLLHPHVCPAKQVAELLRGALSTAQGHHHLQVDEAVRVTDRLARLKHDLRDQDAPVLWHRPPDILQNAHGLLIVPVVQHTLDEVRVV